MENYTKFRLKSPEELEAALNGADNIFVVACNKCFKEFETLYEPECDEFIKLCQEKGKNVTGSINVDFLCNRVQTVKALEAAIPQGTQCVFVISCGLGIQTIGEEIKLPVYSAADSVNYTGHHGMALSKRTCDACAQCYLNLTGGICPIVDCSKGLINGQCGGAKNGCCEVDPNKDCAWERINERLEMQGRLEEFKCQPVQLRDYSKVNHKAITEYVKSIREDRFSGYYGGIHPLERKERTEHMPTVRFPEPETVVIPMSMHVGAPAEPIVKVGDMVKVGQKIGEAVGYVSAPVHSSVSGIVIAVEDRPHPTRGTCLAVEIKSDGKNTLHESVKPNKPLEELTPDEIVEIVRESGIVGKGGAGFPTSVKLKPAKPIEYVLLNGCECEPVITADHRVLLEYTDDVIYGLKALMKAVDAKTGIIVIEDNKPDAIKLMEEKTADLDNIEVRVVKTKYPQGAEKMLIKSVLNRKVPSGGLPADVGALVANISTTKAVSEALRLGMPLIERVITVSGEKVRKPANFVAKVGTRMSELLSYCDGLSDSHNTVKAGGPMMGFPQKNLDAPIVKGSNGLIVVDTEYSEEVSCIKCGRCMDVCPMELKPLYFGKLSDAGDAAGLKERNILDCVECGSCEYICPSKIKLITKIRAGKAAVRGMK